MKGTRWRFSMSDAEKWNWHTEVYAIRRIFLSDHGETSPCDPNGMWYNSGLVYAEERRRRFPEKMDGDAYARSAGWSSALERQDAIVRNVERMEAGLAWQSTHPKPIRRGHIAAYLGVKVREYTAKEMAAGRRQLGLEEQQ